MPGGLLRRQQQPQHVEIELAVEVLRRNAIERREFVDAGIVDENVDRAERPDRFSHHRSSRAGGGEVAMHCDRLSALRRDGGDDLLRARLARRVIDADRSACGSELDGNLGADALRGTGYQCDFAFECLGHDRDPFRMIQ